MSIQQTKTKLAKMSFNYWLAWRLENKGSKWPKVEKKPHTTKNRVGHIFSTEPTGPRR